jgi:hypothetical protein
MEYISYCLFGTNKKYMDGAIENARQARIFYPGWQPIFFCGNSVPRQVIAALKREGALVKICEGPEDFSFTLWRFQAVNLEGATRVIFRDTDSRLTLREVEAVNEWVASRKLIHIMRDHPNHRQAILAGMFGVQADKLAKFRTAVSGARILNVYGDDQEFLRSFLYKGRRRQALIHDQFTWRNFGARPFPTPRQGCAFVGEAFDSRGLHSMINRDHVSHFNKNGFFRLKVHVLTQKEIVSELLKDLRKEIKFALNFHQRY